MPASLLTCARPYVNARARGCEFRGRILGELQRVKLAACKTFASRAATSSSPAPCGSRTLGRARRCGRPSPRLGPADARQAVRRASPRDRRVVRRFRCRRSDLRQAWLRRVVRRVGDRELRGPRRRPSICFAASTESTASASGAAARLAGSCRSSRRSVSWPTVIVVSGAGCGITPGEQDLYWRRRVLTERGVDDATISLVLSAWRAFFVAITIGDRSEFDAVRERAQALSSTVDLPPDPSCGRSARVVPQP